jgi:hypothetical protein
MPRKTVVGGDPSQANLDHLKHCKAKVMNIKKEYEDALNQMFLAVNDVVSPAEPPRSATRTTQTTWINKEGTTLKINELNMYCSEDNMYCLSPKAEITNVTSISVYPYYDPNKFVAQIPTIYYLQSTTPKNSSTSYKFASNSTDSSGIDLSLCKTISVKLDDDNNVILTCLSPASGGSRKKKAAATTPKKKVNTK